MGSPEDSESQDVKESSNSGNFSDKASVPRPPSRAVATFPPHYAVSSLQILFTPCEHVLVYIIVSSSLPRIVFVVPLCEFHKLYLMCQLYSSLLTGSDEWVRYVSKE